MLAPLQRTVRKDTFQTLAVQDSFDPTDVRLMSTHPFAE